jgi:hypothetical protein
VADEYTGLTPCSKRCFPSPRLRDQCVSAAGRRRLLKEDTVTVTLDDVRARMKAAGIEITEMRLEMVRKLLTDALAPIHTLDSRAVRTLEPAVTFDVTRRAEPRRNDDGE